MRILFMIFSLSLAVINTHAWAQQGGGTYQAVGEQTRDWLSLQREGKAASTQPQPVSGAVAAKVYQRYEDSFSHPIPEYFTGDDADASVLDD